MRVRINALSRLAFLRLGLHVLFASAASAFAKPERLDRLGYRGIDGDTWGLMEGLHGGVESKWDVGIKGS